MWHMQHNSYACTNTICMVAFQPPSSILTASCVLPASLHHPHSLLPASVQPQSSIFSDTQVHWPSICFCTYVHWQSIMFDIYICVCIHHSSSLITYMHWSSICMVGLSHTHVQCFFDCLARSIMWVHCDTKDVYPVCSDMTGLYVLNCIYRISTA